MEKAHAGDFLGRCREIISNPLNLLIHRCETAGDVKDGLVTLHNGNRVPLSGSDAYYEDFSKVLVINRGVHEPLEEYVFQQVLRRLGPTVTPVMLELGAYWAHYSMWLKRVFPQATTFLVDADAKNLATGAKNFERHNFLGQFYHARVGNGATFYPDNFLWKQTVSRLHILHADVEGAECAMLKDCGETLQQRRVDFVFLATHSQLLHAQAFAALTAHGYRIEVDADFDTQTTSHDGFIFASNPQLNPVFVGFKPPARTWLTTATPVDLLNVLFETPQ